MTESQTKPTDALATVKIAALTRVKSDLARRNLDISGYESSRLSDRLEGETLKIDLGHGDSITVIRYTRTPTREELVTINELADAVNSAIADAPEGMCVSCKEWTSSAAPCCGDVTAVEGDTVSAESVIESIIDREASRLNASTFVVHYLTKNNLID